MHYGASVRDIDRFTPHRRATNVGFAGSMRTALPARDRPRLEH